MRFRTVLSLATMFMICFTVAAWSSPAATNFVSLPKGPENQSLSGKISSIGDAAFAVDVMKGQEISTIQFLVDGSTKVEGRLSIGAQATVEYRSDNGKNLAVHVIVAPSSSN